jgi:hypothetical protein
VTTSPSTKRKDDGAEWQSHGGLKHAIEPVLVHVSVARRTPAATARARIDRWPWRSPAHLSRPRRQGATGVHPFQRLGHRGGNIEKADAAVKERRRRRSHWRHSSPRARRRRSSAPRGRYRWRGNARGPALEGQRADLGQIQPRRRPGHPVGPGQAQAIGVRMSGGPSWARVEPS